MPSDIFVVFIPEWVSDSRALFRIDRRKRRSLESPPVLFVGLLLRRCHPDFHRCLWKGESDEHFTATVYGENIIVLVVMPLSSVSCVIM